ncbi:MAG: DUF6089 family protein [Bacteroidia bacterium]
MRKPLFLLVFIMTSTFVYSQYAFDYGASAGFSNYLGEIGGGSGIGKKFISDMKIKKTQLALGGFVRYRILPIVSIKAGLNLIRIEGADRYSTNPARVARNLSFRNDLIELELTAQVPFYEIADLGHTYRYRNDFKAYAFAGISGFYNNPKGFYNGEWVALRPLRTENVDYSPIAFAIPAGLGFYFTLEKRHRLGFEFSWRTTFTDYIDDISTVYTDPKNLKSKEAKALANRNGELRDMEGLPSPLNYAPGNKRGDPTTNDSYLTATLNYSYVMRGTSAFYRQQHGSLFKQNSFKKRKIRAKF